MSNPFGKLSNPFPNPLGKKEDEAKVTFNVERDDSPSDVEIEVDDNKPRTRAEVLALYNNIESDIPFGHEYWQMKK